MVKIRKAQNGYIVEHDTNRESIFPQLEDALAFAADKLQALDGYEHVVGLRLHPKGEKGSWSWEAEE